MGALAAVALGLVFLVAGGSKLAAGPAWPEQASGLGAPAFLVPAVPWVELVVGALLIVQIAPIATVIAALAVLVSFTVLIVARLVQGRHPPCACFGAWSAKPLGWGHVVRNLAFIAIGVVALAG